MAATVDNCPKAPAPRSSVYTRTLHRACQNVGSVEALARRLDVPLVELRNWMEGVDAPPENVFLAAVDIALSAPPAANE